ncbi:MAG: DUF3299 domain-containing protein [Alphaproteobacteria bacterium]
MKKLLSFLFVIFCSFTAYGEEIKPIEWQELVPYDLRQRALEIQEKIYNYSPHENPDPAAMTQIKMDDVVKELDGKKIKITGFIVPLEFDTEYVNEFLLAPYIGACIHVPPPPANQIIYVTSKKKVKIDDIYYPFTFEGTLIVKSSQTELAETAYSLDATDYTVENDDKLFDDEIIEEEIPG